MSAKMTQLFTSYKRLKQRRDEAYAKVYAEMDNKRRADKLRKAKSYDTKLSNIMSEINEQARKEGIPAKRRRKR